MNKFLVCLALLLFGAMGEANAQSARRWMHYGADHSYVSRERAMADVDRHMRDDLRWSPEVRQAMNAALRERGTTVYITKGERYDTMRSGARAVWRNVLVDFVAPPVRGRGVEAEVRVRGERWSVTVNGREYELTLPEVCYNWLSRARGESLDCVAVNFETNDPVEHQVAWARYDSATDECFAFRKVGETEESITSSTPWTPIRAGCIGRNCDFGPFNRIVGRTQVAQGTIPLSGPGHYQVRIARNQLIAFCLKTTLVNTRQASSFTAGVRWQQDYRQVNGEWHARIRYQSDDLAANNLRINGPRGHFWWASNQQVEEQMYTQVFASR